MVRKLMILGDVNHKKNAVVSWDSERYATVTLRGVFRIKERVSPLQIRSSPNFCIEYAFLPKEPVNQARLDRKGVEIRALIRGLSESLDLGIGNVVIYCDDYEICDNITGSRSPKEKGVNHVLVEKIGRLSEKFASSQATLVSRNNIKFAYTLARDAIFSQTISANVIKATRGEICVICLEETKAERMFSNDNCLHGHCVSCVNQFVEVKLRDGNVPTCLDDGCKLELTLETCSKILTPTLIELWKHKMKEDSIPATERIYCPYQNCSTLMSKTEISGSDDRSNNVRACVKCSGQFCIDCKVPSHSGLSCAEYKKLHAEPLVNDFMLKSLAKDQNWRQCVKCQHMTCRCGYQFCYKCGVGWKEDQMTCPTGCTRTDHGDFDDDSEDDDPYADLYADGGLSDSPPIPDYMDYYTL